MKSSNFFGLKANVLKYTVLFSLIAIIGIGLYYLNLPNRHKAIIKTKIRHSLSLVDNTWDFSQNENELELFTPTLVIDGIYKSMEGPKVMRGFRMNSGEGKLVFLTGFEVEVLNPNEIDKMSTDYICHTNIDYYDGEHFGRWQLHDRIGAQYPRLTSLSHGLESYQFPKGFGFPVFTDESLFLSTQALNHNISDEVFSIKHKVSLEYSEEINSIKPLTSKTAFIMLPFNKDDPFLGPTEDNPNLCLPVETKNHTYTNNEGQPLSGHWVIFPGEAEYKYDITDQLKLTEKSSLHFAAVHVHPFAQSLSLIDKTLDTVLFKSQIINQKDKIGLQEIGKFSSEEGINLSPDHNYELVLKVNNTTDKNQDMMASMFLFFYDEEMHQLISNYKQ